MIPKKIITTDKQSQEVQGELILKPEILEGEVNAIIQNLKKY